MIGLLLSVAALSAPRAAKLCPITTYGAKPSDGGKTNTAAAAKAIAACAGGGTVVVDGGAFNIGPLALSGKGLFLEVKDGSSLVTMSGPDTWPVTDGRYTTIVSFTKCDGCGLIGAGTIFGKGGRPPGGFDWYYLFDQKKLKHDRPLMLVVRDCNDFTMTSIKLLDAPQFNVALDNVHGAEISKVNITSTWYIDPKTKKRMEPHNTDGIDPGGGSSDIHIFDVWIHNGDDSVAVKPSTPCTRNILVENSHFEYGHGCSIGSVGDGCVENVLYRNITMKNQECGCRVKSYSSKKGHVRNITWDGITMEGTASCVRVNANYKPTPPHPTNFINVSDLFFKNIKGTNCGSDPHFVCPSQSPCRNIVLDNVKLSGKGGKDLKMTCLHAFGTASGENKPKSCLK